MSTPVNCLSGQERRIKDNLDDYLTSEEARQKRGRINRMLKGIRKESPRITVDRARLLTESFKTTEGRPVVIRWARALEHIVETSISIFKPKSSLWAAAALPDKIRNFIPGTQGRLAGKRH